VNNVGSAAEEAAKLFSAMEDWARTRAGHLFDEEHLATGSPECQYCPVCQGIGLLRHVRPEAVEHLLAATASFVAALRTAVTTPPAEPSRPTSPVQHIDIGEA
jgi:hypothetical protein